MAVAFRQDKANLMPYDSPLAGRIPGGKGLCWGYSSVDAGSGTAASKESLALPFGGSQTFPVFSQKSNSTTAGTFYYFHSNGVLDTTSNAINVYGNITTQTSSFFYHVIGDMDQAETS